MKKGQKSKQLNGNEMCAPLCIQEKVQKNNSLLKLDRMIVLMSTISKGVSKRES